MQQEDSCADQSIFHHKVLSGRRNCLQVLNATERHIDWETVKCLVIAGPGFVKDDFKKHMDEEAVRKDLR